MAASMDIFIKKILLSSLFALYSLLLLLSYILKIQKYSTRNNSFDQLLIVLKLK